MSHSNKIMFRDIQSAFPDLFSTFAGDPGASFTGVSSPQACQVGDLVFVPSPKDLQLAHSRGARNFVVHPKLQSSVPADSSSLASANVLLGLARVLDRFFSDRADAYVAPGIHKTAIVSNSAKLGTNVKVDAYAVVGDRTTVGNDVYIGAHTVIEGDVVIGDRTAIFPHCFIGRRTLIGSDCEFKSHCGIGGAGYGFAHDEKGRHYRVPQIGRVVIEDRVEFGAGSMVDRASFEETRIGEGTKFDNLGHIAHNTKIGRNCLLTGSFMTAGSATIGDNVIAGGRTSVTDHVTVCSNVQIGGLSGVSKDVTAPGAYAGYPLLPIKEHLKSTASIPKLPQLRKDVARILKHLGLKEEEKGDQE